MPKHHGGKTSDDEIENEVEDETEKEVIESDEDVEILNSEEDEDIEEPNKFHDETDEPYEQDDTCLYNIGKQTSDKIFESEIFDEDMFDNEKTTRSKKIVASEDRITKPILTKYERVNLLSTRRQQLVSGAKPMIKINKLISEKDIATLELKAKVIPLIILRTLPNKDVERWKVSELEIIN